MMGRECEDRRRRASVSISRKIFAANATKAKHDSAGPLNTQYSILFLAWDAECENVADV